MAGRHAFLSPSGSSRWLTCTPSARLEEPYKKKAVSNDAADEGTLAHKLSELLFNKLFNRISTIKYNADLKKIKNNKHFNAQMFGHCTDYVNFLHNIVILYEDPVFMMESEVDLNEYVPESFGTNDFKLIAPSILKIVDLKYGKGVLVEAKENKQMMLYALGELKAARMMYDIETVSMTIYQPRIDNIDTFEIKADDLLKWGETYVMPRAKLAFEGKGDFQPGKHCQFCLVRNQCKALADYNMDIASEVFEDPHLLSDEETARIIEKADDTIKWLNSVKKHALHEAVHNNKTYPGLKLIAGRSNRIITDPEEVVKILKKAKVENSLYLSSPQLMSIGPLEKNIGKTKLEKLIGSYIIKPPGKLALVPEWHKSPAINGTDAAKMAFEDVDETSDDEN